jgi:hypothetical protein
MNLQTIPYHSYEKGLPQEGNFILGQRNAENIFVYQAFKDKIADFAIKYQKFGGQDYSFKKMTWITPNFLWMMHSSNWAAKDNNQNRILAIEMTFEGFEELLSEGVLTSYVKLFGDEQIWKEKLNNSNVLIQWDPDYNFKGEKLKRRAVQIGIKDEALQKFNDKFIKSIQDITNFVKEQKKSIDKKKEFFIVIYENIIEVSSFLKAKFEIPQKFTTPFVEGIISEFDKTKSVCNEKFEVLLINNQRPERLEFVDYIKNYQNNELSRYLLKKAILYRKGELGTYGCMCEDLLMFSFFTSKNKEITDFDLIMEAKMSDFDTWCGFDGEMIFYTLGYQGTKDYLKENAEKFTQKTVDYFLEFDKDYLYNDINSRAFWYL